MEDLSPEIEISQPEAESIARGLFAVARADGEIHEREAAIIAQFYADAADHPSTMGDLARGPAISAAALAAQLQRPELRRLFLKTGFLMAYADNVYSPGEAKLLASFGKAMGVADGEMRELETQAKEFLMSQLSHLANTEAVVAVAKGLK